MTYQVLSRKWRPRVFDDVIGQSHITRSLQNAIIQEKIGHAYLFTGTRGIGKTSIARIFAKALRCSERTESGNPCLSCPSCISMLKDSAVDFIEIDGASNNGVENIRQLIENVQYLPTFGKYKVYVIDEVHMLSTSAFNALLKTLEEPPAHVIFVFATTDPEKLLGTVLSRCQRFDFRNANVADLVLLLQKIAKNDQISYESDNILREIAKQGKGSVRDTLSLLDQVLSYATDKNIKEDDLIASLGLAKLSAVRDLISAIMLSDTHSCSSLYQSMIYENVPVKNIVGALLDALYQIIQRIDDVNFLVSSELINEGDLDDISSAELFWIYESLVKDVNFTLKSIDPVKVTEIMLQKLCLRRTFLFGDDPKIFTQKKTKETDKCAASDKQLVEEEAAPEQLEVESLSNVEVEIEKPAKIAEVVPEVVEKPVEVAEVAAEVVEKPVNEESPIVRRAKTWDDFLDFMRTNNPASASNLEQGNIVGEIDCSADKLGIQLGFTKSSQVFLDYLKEKDVFNRLEFKVAEFFGYSQEDISLALTLIDEDFKNRQNFQSKADIARDAEKKTHEEEKNSIVNNPFVKEAEELFKTKVDQVRVNNR